MPILLFLAIRKMGIESKKPVKVYKANLTLNNKWHPTPQIESLIISSKKILRFLKASKRQEITKYELEISFRYIPGNVLDTLIDELVEGKFIVNGGDYLLILNPNRPSIETLVYYLTAKGEKEIENSWKAWYSMPDTKWKIFVFFGSPLVAFFFGYYLGRHFH